MSAWTKYNDESQSFRHALAKEAKRCNCWIFVASSKKWYSPEEFINSNESVSVYRNTSNQKDFQIKDPRIGLKERVDFLKRYQEELAIFTERLNNYFDLKVKS